jgi:sec-independent protein translocase protein TatB
VFNLQGSEIIVILLIALVVLGPERLPDAVRRFMQTYNELRKMGSGFQSEIKSAFDEPMRELRDTAQTVRNAADPAKFLAEAEAEQRLRAEAAGDTSPATAGHIEASTNGASSNGASNGGTTRGDVLAAPGSPPPPPPAPPPLPTATTSAPAPSRSSPPPPPPPPPRAP